MNIGVLHTKTFNIIRLFSLISLIFDDIYGHENVTNMGISKMSLVMLLSILKIGTKY